MTDSHLAWQPECTPDWDESKRAECWVADVMNEVESNLSSATLVRI